MELSQIESHLSMYKAMGVIILTMDGDTPHNHQMGDQYYELHQVIMQAIMPSQNLQVENLQRLCGYIKNCENSTN